MLVHSSRGIPIHRFARIARFSEVLHFVAGRRGGVSEPPFASLNLSFRVGDLPSNVIENRNRLAASLGVPVGRFVFARLVHGADVLQIDETICDQNSTEAPAAADALITSTPGIMLSIVTADCVPLLFYDPTRQAIGIAHAGRLGTLLGMAEHVVQSMRSAFDTEPSDVLVGIGPSIGPESYDVTEATALEARAIFHDESVARRGTDGRWYLDLWSCNQRQLVASGVLPEHIEHSGVSTRLSDAEFFSERAEKPTGRFVSGIMLNG